MSDTNFINISDTNFINISDMNVINMSDIRSDPLINQMPWMALIDWMSHS